MQRLFDPGPIRAQLENLIAERERIERAIEALQSALRNLEDVLPEQGEFRIGLRAADTTLHDAVKRACFKMTDGITRSRVIAEIERQHPLLKPKPPSVASSLINLTKGEHPMLYTAIEGRGRSPSLYSTQGTTEHRLSAEEVKELFDEMTTKGTGGWQSLFASLQKDFDKSQGIIRLTPEQRGRIYNYCRSYGGGGWQERIKRIFRRELPHLFIEST